MNSIMRLRVLMIVCGAILIASGCKREQPQVILVEVDERPEKRRTFEDLQPMQRSTPPVVQPGGPSGAGDGSGQAEGSGGGQARAGSGDGSGGSGTQQAGRGTGGTGAAGTEQDQPGTGSQAHRGASAAPAGPSAAAPDPALADNRRLREAAEAERQRAEQARMEAGAQAAASCERAAEAANASATAAAAAIQQATRQGQKSQQSSQQAVSAGRAWDTPTAKKASADSRQAASLAAQAAAKAAQAITQAREQLAQAERESQVHRQAVGADSPAATQLQQRLESVRQTIRLLETQQEQAAGAAKEAAQAADKAGIYAGQRQERPTPAPGTPVPVKQDPIPITEIPTVPNLPTTQPRPVGIIRPTSQPAPQARVLGRWRQSSGGTEADFLCGGYDENVLVFRADGLLEVKRSFGGSDGITLTWRIGYRWNKSQTHLILGEKANERPTPQSLRGFDVAGTKAKVTPPTISLPAEIPCRRLSEQALQIGGKDYRSDK